MDNTELKSYFFKNQQRYKDLEAKTGGGQLPDGEYEGFIESYKFERVTLPDFSFVKLTLQIRVVEPEIHQNKCAFKDYNLDNDVAAAILKGDLQRFNIFDDSLENLSHNLDSMKNRDFTFTKKTKKVNEKEYTQIYMEKPFDLVQNQQEAENKQDISDI